MVCWNVLLLEGIKKRNTDSADSFSAYILGSLIEEEPDGLLEGVVIRRDKKEEHRFR
jgi:hypothetical protein